MLADTGERKIFRNFRIAKTDDRKLRRDFYAVGDAIADNSRRRGIISAEDRLRRFGKLKQFSYSLFSPFTRKRMIFDVFFVNFKTMFLQNGLVSVKTAAGGRVKLTPDVGDPPMPESTEIFHRGNRPGKIIGNYTGNLAFLRKKDLNKGTLSYRRKKTGQLLFIKWEPCMQEIVDRYFDAESPYLLPLIKKAGVKERNQYINGMHQINKYLGKIGEDMNIPIPLTLYVARHTWASVAKSKNIPLSVICEGMGHDSETTTRIYLTSLDTTPIDRANHLILNSL